MVLGFNIHTYTRHEYINIQMLRSILENETKCIVHINFHLRNALSGLFVFFEIPNNRGYAAECGALVFGRVLW